VHAEAIAKYNKGSQQKLKILLLYARKNEDFQSVVYTFTEELQKTLGCDFEV
jgi:hypothetical protein